ncbi:MAG: N-acetyl sugar amidotransferase [Vicinamibacterales bacterium]
MSYRICRRCVMDTSDIEITFDADGICHHCKLHDQRVLATPFSKPGAEASLARMVERVRASRKGDYDSIVGLSGGVDSSYVAYQAVKLGLRPLAVHFDNGWNSELAVKNIEQMVTKLGLDLHTFVIDWEEFRDIQRSFFQADVVDIEMVTDLAIFASMFRIARQHGIRYILSGTNAATESIMPPTWQHFKFDLRNLKAIHRRYGTRPIKRYPTLGVFGMAWNHYVTGFQSISLLNYLPYRKADAIETLSRELNWQYYGGKHYESTFTKFYQAHILPVKFGVDKRRIHFSDLIVNGEMTRDEALHELEQPLYDPLTLEQDREYVCKKLGFSVSEFEEYMNRAPVSHYAFPSYARLAHRMVDLHRRLRYRHA